ncbi:hypothetical protein A3D00_03480 [Candidatus Woesebacteria bacterium RIFCSPHIGHO2_02_FULL_38_9]|uniref:Thioredoxin domain-containing protein n=1 Tax=Candidatus Woesebacteria bacterium RIFCSPHIGHO2_01_FULL_39_28 TaxID=1802496 RepID=A0A1F7YGT4_9BACT|nr:MAG: hypothetical protein A2627_00735 [Candidatus Woesebacteria bacterium RIFCSPHIGHO2_01_FULL_39_28]OGM32559.1 MAG: hypothetical protein A3D00_03480 [Candidatus Woesebacteria bacterium RIFCSPHIGHO2_02_FULL_38_9]OGM58754.1 MAG: hypothetical protein A3A50_03125 [Candidatus Woesebacteria bacterium RIFCSPLOWO2_01_FULL_38_20]
MTAAVKKPLYILIGAALVVGLIFIGKGWLESNNTPGKLDEFAKCLKDKKAVFYGAYWCSHCQNQKKEFGKSEKFLPYVECSTPDGRGQLKYCTDKNIEGYPTWEFADGSRESGEVSLEKLSEKTDCSLPQ